ncbi:MAG TPA: alpha/beta hydrolase-fold protein [Anaerolineae bacterium]|nr:alpha/beta hydrolase-fold protein [Anaerolineae bacterium]
MVTGCQGGEVEGASDPTLLAASTLPTLSEVTSAKVMEIVPTTVQPTASPTPQPTFTPSPTPTPTPYYCTYLRGRTESTTFSSKAMGEQVRLLVHLPPCYDDYPAAAFPVVYVLHGWPLDERHWDTLGIDEVLDDWIIRGMVGPAIIVMPGVSADGLYVNSSGGSWSFEGMLVDELVPLIDQTYRTWRDPAGRAIGGVSRGGVWALEIAFRHPDMFSIVGGHSPALALNRPMPQYDPFLLIKEGAPGVRIYLDAGDLDWAKSSTANLYEALRERGADVTYQVHSGGHVDKLWQESMTDYVAFYTATWPRSYAALPVWESIPPTPTP